MAFLDRDQRRLYFEHHANPGRAVVLVHGWAATSDCWDVTVAALLAAGHEVVLVDLRAHGRSDRDFADVTVAALASDVVALVRTLGLDRPVLNGWSTGGPVAVAAAAELGDEISGLVLTAATSPRYTAGDGWPFGGSAEDSAAAHAAVMADRATTFRALATASFVKPPSDDAVQALWLQMMSSGAGVADTMEDLFELDQRDLLEGVRCPVLMLNGTADAFVPIEGARTAESLFRDARLVEFPGVGHAPFVEDAPRYRTELLGFLAGV